MREAVPMLREQVAFRQQQAKRRREESVQPVEAGASGRLHALPAAYLHPWHDSFWAFGASKRNDEP